MALAVAVGAFIEILYLFKWPMRDCPDNEAPRPAMRTKN
jgi:hypothetical protein